MCVRIAFKSKCKFKLFTHLCENSDRDYASQSYYSCPISYSFMPISFVITHTLLKLILFCSYPHIISAFRLVSSLSLGIKQCFIFLFYTFFSLLIFLFTLHSCHYVFACCYTYPLDIYIHTRMYMHVCVYTCNGCFMTPLGVECAFLIKFNNYKCMPLERQ